MNGDSDFACDWMRTVCPGGMFVVDSALDVKYPSVSQSSAFFFFFYYLLLLLSSVFYSS